MSLVLVCIRKITKLNDTVKGGGWKRVAAPDVQRKTWRTMHRLRGLTLGLVGLGRVPNTLVRKANGFGGGF